MWSSTWGRAAMVGFLTLSCASSPKTYNYDRSEVYEASYDDVWEAVIDVFAENDWPIQTLEKDSGIISTSRATMDKDSNWSECDTGMFGNLRDKAGSFNVRVREVGSGQSSLTVTTTFEAGMSGIGGYERKPCVSTGQLEMQIQYLVRQKLRD